MMIWVLSTLLLAGTTEACQLNLKEKKQIKPIASTENGAQIVSHIYAETQDLCHKGCCNVSQCDTSFYVGSMVGKQGSNCYYFNCMEKCVIEDSKGNFSISHRLSEGEVNAAVVKAETIQNSNIMPTNNTEIKDTLSEEKIKFLNSGTNGTEVTNDTAIVEIVEDSTNEESIISDNLNSNKSSESNNTMAVTETIISNSDESSEGRKETANKADETTIFFSVNTTFHDKNVPPTMKMEAGLENIDDKPVTNPLPAVNNTANLDFNDSSVNRTVPEEELVGNINSSVVTTGLKVEIDINDASGEAKYTVKDVVFWVSVVGGAGLILFGFAMIIRVYRNKRRRLYSSLTDDYLINGMYSI